jgi:hypothetical protein
MMRSRLALLPSSVAIAEQRCAQDLSSLSMAGLSHRSSLRPVAQTGSSRPLIGWQPVLRSASASDGRERGQHPALGVPSRSRPASYLHPKLPHKLSNSY